MYATVQDAPEAGRTISWNEWRAARNDLFQRHRQSPLSADQRAHFRGLDYYPYDPGWRIVATVSPDPASQRFHYQLGADGEFTMKRVGWASFKAKDVESRLGLYWIEGYGGGLFLPFKDSTNRRGSYGGGRYLYDTIKGVDLGVMPGAGLNVAPDEAADSRPVAGRAQIVLDFNFAYNPSCAYHSRWVCPLAPAENTLPYLVQAGEKRFVQAESSF
ncbi:MAG: DUF1684 domain-containing protein [Chloroflexota bacterium]|nr:MAG: DUF1684 domain-containing protein [Chloroflexota bacterium]